MDIDVQRRRQAHEVNTIRDFGMYGTYTPELRYRQARMEAECASAGIATPRLGRIRTRIGNALIRVGQRLEGRDGPGCPYHYEPVVS